MRLWPTIGILPPFTLEVARFDSLVGRGRATTSSARRKVRSASHSSNSVPKPPSRGPPPDSSQCPPRLAGAAVTTEMAAERAGSMPYLSDHAAAAVGALTELSAARQSAPR